MLQINFSYTFTSKKETNKHSCGVCTLAACARTCSIPFACTSGGTFVPFPLGVFQLPCFWWQRSTYSWVTEGLLEVLNGQLVMGDVFVGVGKYVCFYVYTWPALEVVPLVLSLANNLRGGWWWYDSRVEPSWQYSLKCCCSATDSMSQYDTEVQRKQKVWHWIFPYRKKAPLTFMDACWMLSLSQTPLLAYASCARLACIVYFVSIYIKLTYIFFFYFYIFVFQFFFVYMFFFLLTLFTSTLFTIRKSALSYCNYRKRSVVKVNLNEVSENHINVSKVNMHVKKVNINKASLSLTNVVNGFWAGSAQFHDYQGRGISENQCCWKRERGDPKLIKNSSNNLRRNKQI